MKIEKLVERLKGHKGALCELLYKKDMEDAATALSTLQTKNKKLRAEVEQVKHALAMMWFAYVNSDKETPHRYETEAIEEAERLLGPREECMPKYLKRGQMEGLEK